MGQAGAIVRAGLRGKRQSGSVEMAERAQADGPLRGVDQMVEQLRVGETAQRGDLARGGQILGGGQGGAARVIVGDDNGADRG